MTTPDWVAVGAEVATMRSSGEFTYTTVKRVNSTDIVLANGERLRIRDMRPLGKSSGVYFKEINLYPVSLARRLHTASIVRTVSCVASSAERAVGDDEAGAFEALDAVQAAIDEARRKLAELALLSDPAERRLADEHGGLISTYPPTFDAPPVRAFNYGSQAYGP